jgi:hypothetical protein
MPGLSMRKGPARGVPRVASAPKAGTGQLGLFPPSHLLRATPTRVLIVGVEGEQLERHSAPDAVVGFSADLGIRYVADWEVQASGRAPDFWIASACTDAPNRRVLFETITGELCEQDDEGRIWLDDQPLRPGALLGFGTPTRPEDGTLHLGEPAALLIGSVCVRGWQMRLYTTSALVWIHETPRPRPGATWPRGWLALAGYPAPAGIGGSRDAIPS